MGSSIDRERSQSPVWGGRERSRSPIGENTIGRRGRNRPSPMDENKETSSAKLFVGNLSYDVRQNDLEEFLSKAGNIVYCDVLTSFNGRSKGCGVVEYGSVGEAQRAIDELGDQDLMGRLVHLREDRGPPSGDRSRRRFERGFGGGGYADGGSQVRPGTQLYVSGLPYHTSWQDLKDLFRKVGKVVRADINMTSDKLSKGTGIVSFETVEDAQNAIREFNNTEYGGRRLEVREDRLAGYPLRGGRGAPPRRSSGDFYDRGSYMGQSSRGRRPSMRGNMPHNPFTDDVTSGTERSAIIFVRNLPWQTTNEDLVDLFTTIGTVEQAEIQFEPSGRSKGTGVVKFENEDIAEDAITKFQGYMYGGRPLGISFARYLRSNSLDYNGNAIDEMPMEEKASEGQFASVDDSEDVAIAG